MSAAILFNTAHAVAPDVPRWFLGLIARVLAAPISLDCRLLLADAIEEQAIAAATEGEVSLAAQLHRLADLPRTSSNGRAFHA